MEDVVDIVEVKVEANDHPTPRHDHQRHRAQMYLTPTYKRCFEKLGWGHRHHLPRGQPPPKMLSQQISMLLQGSSGITSVAENPVKWCLMNCPALP
mmetsp:Transcript_90121/g.255205  ORF Transcript_90121/g.255205 Transcript_90121/m.255205 type:complete len:96 (+) Transcript_90121:149-436(+)